MMLPIALATAGSSTVTFERYPPLPKQANLSRLRLSPQLLAQREARTALVIGNSAYKEGRLQNPVNDATAMAQALKAVGFEVTLLTNANKQQFREAIRAFNTQLRQGGVGLFYYAGHGIQVDGKNYLIPIGAENIQKYEVEDETVSLDTVLRAMADAGTQVKIVLLDACRSNPYRSWGRSISRGLAIPLTPEGTFISFATAPGEAADDGGGRNSPYTASVLQYIQESGLPIETMFKRVRQSVWEKTGKKQSPWEQNSLIGEFIFNRKESGTASPQPLPQHPSPPPDDSTPPPHNSQSVLVGTWQGIFPCGPNQYVLRFSVSGNNLIQTVVSHGGDNCLPNGHVSVLAQIPDVLSQGSIFPTIIYLGTGSQTKASQIQIIDANTLKYDDVTLRRISEK